MATIFNKFQDYLRGSKSVMDPAGGVLFPAPDLDYIKREAGLEQKAADDGSKNLPGADATAPSPVELDIKRRLEEVRDRHRSDYNSMLDYYGEQVKGYNEMAQTGAMGTAFRAYMTQLQNLRINLVEGKLFSRRESLRSLAKSIRGFRQEHGLLGRAPDFPAKRDMVWFWLMLAVAGELVLNFFLLQEAGSAFQVTAQSLLYALINVLLPFFFIPDQLRGFSHIKLWRRLLAGAMTVFYIVVWCLSVNLLMAHYRGVVLDIVAAETGIQAVGAAASDYSSLMQDYFNSQSIAWERFWANPFGLDDVWSWFLFGCGVGLSLFAVSKGYANDDSYPGYGRLKRHYDEEEDSYIKLTESTLAQFQSHRNKADEEIKLLSRTLSDDYLRMQQAITSAQGLMGRCKDAFARLDTCLQSLVQDYRQRNQEQRTQPPPGYFSEPMRLDPPGLNEFQHTEAADPAEAIRQLRDWANELNSLHDDLSSQIKTVQGTLQEDYPFEVTKP